MKKIFITFTLIIVGCIFLIQTMPTNTASTTVENIRIASRNDTTAIIEVKKPNQTATFPAPLINAYGNKVADINLDGCALIDTTSQAFVTMPLWAANTIKSALGDSRYGVLSPSGMLYTNFEFKKGGSGWAPGFLTYSNYLGNAPITPESDMAGSINLVNICNGPCQK